MASLFELIKAEGLTSIKIRHDPLTEKILLRSSRQWDEKNNWAEYNKTFCADDILNAGEKYYNHNETTALIHKHGLSGYLNKVFSLIKKGNHYGINFYCDLNKNIRFIGCINSDRMGINNGSHAIRSGGIRRHDLEEPELDVIEDGLNLARAMTYKNIGAEIPYGGCKIVVHSDPACLDDLNEMGFLAYAIDRMRCFTGPDMGYPCELADTIKEHFSRNILGGTKGPLGPTGKPTAYGTKLAIKQAVKFLYGTESLAKMRIALQGLGSVGFSLAEYLLEEDADLFVSDICEDNLKKIKAVFPTHNITIVHPDEIYYQDADIFAPCALGGIIDEEKINNINFKIIIGAANNQLKACNQAEEFRLAHLLEDKGIIFQCDWVHNVGGVLAGEEEYRNQEKADLTNVIKKIERLCRENTWKNLSRAKDLNVSPTEVAYQEAEKALLINDYDGGN